MVSRGSILVGLTGQGKTRGKATLLDFDSTISQHVAYVTPDKGQWDNRFLLWVLRSSYDDLRRISDENGSTKGGLTCAHLATLSIPTPHLDDQREIVAYLDEQTAQIDELIAECEGFIEVATERRAALITAAVTGQIDVRSAR